MSLTFEQFSGLEPKQKAQFYSQISNIPNFQQNLYIPLSQKNPNKKVTVKTSYPFATLSKKYYLITNKSSRSMENQNNEQKVTNKISPSSIGIKSTNTDSKTKIFKLQNTYLPQEEKFYKEIPEDKKIEVQQKLGLLSKKENIVLAQSQENNNSYSSLNNKGETMQKLFELSNQSSSQTQTINFVNKNPELEGKNILSNNIEKKMENNKSTTQQVNKVVSTVVSNVNTLTQQSNKTNQQIEKLINKLKKNIENAKNTNFKFTNGENSNNNITKMTQNLTQLLKAKKQALKVSKNAEKVEQNARKAKEAANAALQAIPEISEKLSNLSTRVSRLEGSTQTTMVTGGSKKKRSSSKSKKSTKSKSKKTKKSKTKKSSSRK